MKNSYTKINLKEIESEVGVIERTSDYYLNAYKMSSSFNGVISIDSNDDFDFEYDRDDSQYVVFHLIYYPWYDLNLAKYQIEACYKSEVPYTCKISRRNCDDCVDCYKWRFDIEILLSKSALKKYKGQLSGLINNIVCRSQHTVPTIKREAFSDCLVICQQ